ncbi:crossover junction endodeoxyribonuclease RuvC [Sediminispirochaeta smaragdinae]|jgi:crossover junction endodeoxyribonuclease RuvC|uniref:Crossover junction endodeoxyribonuclease RuvC n=1 Tax=Sediminispirochaeta smaragdinae (strain DSM 11293 / JCM 15392 / SEBR 4228) TaxID=573413 RepID=E1R1J6_SEDSS|nr:crossover junction endodeoxyribonuclease RuvC [Sediminispirochaeta smaragdinae]ADK81137.1 crossover junction endodeoxyribonuclease RuvC [Sediminispirochaeta smaragdinae DSM 11293]
MTRILGLDPGFAETGWGVVEAEGNRFRHVDHGAIRTKAKEQVGFRLSSIYDAVKSLVEQYRPECCGIEELYFAKNITSALPVAQARGVLLLVLEQHSIVTESYSPPLIKQTITGVGRADKRQVQEMVRLLLGLTEIPKPDHAADALAAALTHASFRFSSLRGVRRDI